MIRGSPPPAPPTSTGAPLPEGIVRYAIQVLLNNTEANHPRYVARAVGIHLDGELSTHLEDARTWATPRGAERWMRGRGDGDHDWRQARETAGQTVTVVPVRMHPRMKTVPSRLAAHAPRPPSRPGSLENLSTEPADRVSVGHTRPSHGC